MIDLLAALGGLDEAEAAFVVPGFQLAFESHVWRRVFVLKGLRLEP